MKILSTTKQIEAYIKERILNQELQPGDVIKEVELAQKLDLSRSPIREALFQLRSEGLLTFESKRKKCITKLSRKDIEDSYESAGFIEGSIVSSTIHLFTQKDFQKIKNITLQFLDADYNDNGRTVFFDIDDQFHKYLMSKSSNDILKNMHRRSCHNISKLLLCSVWPKAFTRQEMYDRHRLIVSQLETKDRFLVEEALHKHYFDTGCRMIETANIV